MRSIALALSGIGLAAIAVSGCNNQLAQPMPGETPASVNPATPGYNAAGGPLVPANDPNSKLTPTPSGGTGQGYYGTTGAPLTPPNAPSATPDAASTQSKQEKGGYFPNPDAPLAPR